MSNGRDDIFIRCIGFLSWNGVETLKALSSWTVGVDHDGAGKFCTIHLVSQRKVDKTNRRQ